MTSTTRRDLMRVPDFRDWVDDLPAVFTWPGQLGLRSFRLEEHMDDDKYVIRAELPGIDPDKDVTVEVKGDQLTIHTERADTREENDRSEFHYGEFTRRVTLPRGADAMKANAHYRAGILEVTMPIVHEQVDVHTVPVKVG